jgi:hypothetical protein
MLASAKQMAARSTARRRADAASTAQHVDERVLAHLVARPITVGHMTGLEHGAQVGAQLGLRQHRR